MAPVSSTFRSQSARSHASKGAAASKIPENLRTSFGAFGVSFFCLAFEVLGKLPPAADTADMSSEEALLVWFTSTSSSQSEDSTSDTGESGNPRPSKGLSGSFGHFVFRKKAMGESGMHTGFGLADGRRLFEINVDGDDALTSLTTAKLKNKHVKNLGRHLVASGEPLGFVCRQKTRLAAAYLTP
ncbi:hypothetical protein BJ741DRAFT_612084 [Chytriomyces cf. hyalinus JEL632]|nr:hypothetical protein BJ741DRAFT_612084 [Chytriomyces cf. hyalinus JEL632]